MSEMKEMSFILQNATDNSFIIIDELGRGTSKRDGMGIAAAIFEYLQSLGAYTLCVTHFSELAILENMYPNVANYHLMVEHAANSLPYPTYMISPGFTPEMRYGIDMAEIAGSYYLGSHFVYLSPVRF